MLLLCYGEMLSNAGRGGDGGEKMEEKTLGNDQMVEWLERNDGDVQDRKKISFGKEINSKSPTCRANILMMTSSPTVNMSLSNLLMRLITPNTLPVMRS